MNKQLWIVLIPAVSWFLFALGGTGISDVAAQGKKWIRRFILPAIYGLCLFLAHFTLWQAGGVAIISCGMFHLGYGHNTSWKMKILVFISYGIISLPIGISIWNLITVIGVALMFVLNKLKLSSLILIWKCAEGVIGALIGIQISYLMAGFGFLWIK